MATFELDLDLGSALEVPRRCPRCASATLAPVVHDGVVVFRCRACGGAWKCQLGALTAVTGPPGRPAPEEGSSPQPQRTAPA